MEKKKIGILVDTAGGNDPAMYKGTNIDLIPLHIVFKNNDGTEILDDILDTPENIEKTNFYQKIKDGGNITTSTASPGELMEKYDAMLEEYEQIVHFPIPANLSSMYQNSVLVSQDDKYKGKVTVFESAMAANGIKEFALALNKKINNNELKTIEEIGKFAKDYEAHMVLDIIPGDPKKLAKGGRAVKIVQGILSIFKTKIMIRWEEKPRKDALGRTIGNLTRVVLDHLDKEYNNKNYKFIFVDTPLTEQKLVNNATQTLDEAHVKYVRENIPTLYAAHAGVDTIGFVIVATNL